jgi:hypothetical protein
VFIDAPGLVGEDRERARHGYAFGGPNSENDQGKGGWSAIPGGTVEFVRQFAAGQFCSFYYLLWILKPSLTLSIIQKNTTSLLFCSLISHYRDLMGQTAGRCGKKVRSAAGEDSDMKIRSVRKRPTFCSKISGHRLYSGNSFPPIYMMDTLTNTTWTAEMTTTTA